LQREQHLDRDVLRRQRSGQKREIEVEARQGVLC
jgi:hypothetical protein